MQRLPVGLALPRALLGGGGRLYGWGHGHRDRPIRKQDRLLAHQGIDGLEGLFMGQKHLVERFSEILQQVEPVRDLGGRGRALARALSIGL
jgi:hypothetical protein